MMRRWRNQRDPWLCMPQMGDERSHFGWRELTTLAGLGALCHLDLQLFRAHQVLGGYAKARRGNLLDLAAHGIPVEGLVVPGRIFATFAGIVASTNAIHGRGNRAVRLRTERAYRHSRDNEARANRFHRLNFFQRYRCALLEGEQIAQYGRWSRIYQLGKLLIIL